MRSVNLILLCISLSLLSGCTPSDEPVKLEESKVEQVNDLTNVRLEIVEDTLSREGLILLIVNESDKTLVYNGSFFLEQKVDGKWYEVKDILDGKFGFEDIGYGTDPQDSSELVIQWEWLYGELNSGEYRLIKDVLDFRASGDYDKHYLAVEFELTD